MRALNLTMENNIEISLLNPTIDDVIFIKANSDKISSKECIMIYNKIKEMFPHNRIICNYGGLDIDIIKGDIV